MSPKTGMCQSCGMPMNSDADFGTEPNGTLSSMYCHFCYQDGHFTEPDISLDQMVERVAPIMNQMFEMPMDNAKIFSRDQLMNLFRWSGRMISSCESCGMPLVSDEVTGTEKDGTKSQRYCIHCYQNGAFTEPDLTKETMIKKYSPLISSQFGVPASKAEEMVRNFTATLPRWK
jgi:hypothetical protein